MNQGKRNIVFVGFQEKEIEQLKFKDIRSKKKVWNDTDLTHRFPRLVYLNSLKEAKRHQGLILFLKMEKEINFVEYDIKNRKQFKNYDYVFLIVDEKDRIERPYQIFNIVQIISWHSKIALMKISCLVYHPGLQVSLESLYEMYLKKSYQTLSKTRLHNIERLKQYVQDKTYIDIKKAALELHVSTKWIERYLKDMNFCYHNVGYDKEKRMFYVTK